jgi:hypothetical protein
MKTIRDLDELGRDPNTITRLANTSLENMVDIEPPADLSEFDILPSEKEGGRAARHLHPRHVRQHVDDLLRQTVTEKLVLFVCAHVGERQYGDGPLVLGGFRVRLCCGFLQRRSHLDHGLIALLRLFGQASPYDSVQTGGGETHAYEERVDRRWIVVKDGVQGLHR